MSKDNPGVRHDATNSWNGYNHQGKIALFYAVKEIVRLLKAETDRSVAYKKLESLFLEIEYTEDFSTGTIDALGKQHYQTVHQVKDRQDTGLSKYESAIQGLAVNLVRHPEVENAYLHVTVKVSTVPKDKQFIESVEEMVRKTDWLDMQECEAQKEDDPDKKQIMLDDVNILRAGLERLVENKKELGKIQKYSYEIDDGAIFYCPKDKAKSLIKKSLLDFYSTHDPTVDYKHGEIFLNKSYQYLLEKLNDHIVYRAKHYGEQNVIRYILFSQLYDWLASSEIENMGDDYHLYYIKEGYFEFLDECCEICKEEGNDSCGTCQVLCFKSMLRGMRSEELKTFIYRTNPDVPNWIGDGNNHKFLQQDRIQDPFWVGLHGITQKLDEPSKRRTVTYVGTDKRTYTLTTLARRRLSGKNEVQRICTEIYTNQTKRALNVDSNCLISRDVEVDCVRDNILSIKPRDMFYDRNNVMDTDPISIIPMEKIAAVFAKKEGTDHENDT